MFSFTIYNKSIFVNNGRFPLNHIYYTYMIGYLTGNILLATDKYILLDVSGVGYKVFVTPDTLQTLSQENKVSLFTYLVVKEDALDLYGFTTLAEKEMFELLISVSGVGPKGALGILSVATLETLKKAIAGSELAYLTQVSGIGKKTAEKLVVELRDKLKHWDTGTDGFIERGDSDVFDALKALGYTQNEARLALEHISDSSTDTNTRIKEALKYLGK